MNSIPRFFKVFILPNSSQKMLLPEALVTRITIELPKQVLLRNHRGKIWLTKIKNSRNKSYFTEGWAKFVNDNNIKHNDILVFDFDGNYVFDVKVYGTNTCNKKAPESSDEELDSESMEYEESENEKESEELTWEDSYKEGEEPAEKDEEELSSYGNNQTRNMGRFSNGSRERKKSTKNCGKKEESGDPSEDEDEVFKHGVYARPKTPHFLTKLRRNRTNELLVPSEVIKDFKLELGEKIMILDESDRKWEAKVKVWKDGRTWLVDGWRAFHTWNDLKWEDRCLCEFVREMGTGELYLKIRILRAGSWFPK